MQEQWGHGKCLARVGGFRCRSLNGRCRATSCLHWTRSTARVSRSPGGMAQAFRDLFRWSFHLFRVPSASSEGWVSEARSLYANNVSCPAENTVKKYGMALVEDMRSRNLGVRYPVIPLDAQDPLEETDVEMQVAL